MAMDGYSSTRASNVDEVPPSRSSDDFPERNKRGHSRRILLTFVSVLVVFACGVLLHQPVSNLFGLTAPATPNDPIYPIPVTMYGEQQPSEPYAFVVQIQHKGEFCVGTLLSPNWVISAAHCNRLYSVGETAVVAGTPTPDQGGETAIVDGVVLHPGYRLNYDPSFNVKPESIGDDLALLHLNRPMNVPVATLSGDISPGVELRGVAFQMNCSGTTSQRRCHNPRQQQVGLRTVAPGGCAGIAPVLELCLRYDQGKGMCRGTSGAPLFQPTADGVRLAAVVSRDGDMDGSCIGGAAIVTSVARYAPWIARTITPGLGPDGLPAIAGPRR
jgi:secreted trypsin-like serine protease